MVRQAFSKILVASLLCGSAGWPGVAGTAAAAGNTQFLLFNVAPAGNYAVRKNGAAMGSRIASPAGSMSLSDQNVVGDTYQFSLTGIQPVTPSRPAAFVAAGRTDGCVALAWTAAPTGDYVTDYSLLWGRDPGVYTDSLRIDRLDIVRNGSQSTHTRCGMPSGTFHFALRAHNSFNRWSGLSSPSTTTISNQNTAGPVAPTNVRVSEPGFGCAQVTWNRVGDPTVTGYRVYFGTQRRSQAAYTDSIDAGNAASASRCGLAAGTYYFAVRSYTGTGSFSGYSTEVTLVAQGIDNTPPAVSQRTPPVGATGVPTNATIFFVLADDKTGVEPNSIVVRANGSTLPRALTPSSNGYAVQCDPATDFPPNTVIQIELTAADRASPANVLSRTWSFTTGNTAANDVTAPTLSIVSPSAGAVGVDPRPTITVTVADAGLGVDFGTVEMRVNGTQVGVTVDGTPNNAQISYRPATAFPANSEIRVEVDACDRAAVSNCANTLSFSFVVGANLAATTAAIVPDGFWANDPGKPLEVRNLPRSWTVRIFDPTGASVRRFQSNSDGYTWSWDFTNDNGQRVAPALYLVRVTDDDGSVQSAGRFLVQSEQ